jgi:hypothetical protein
MDPNVASLLHFVVPGLGVVAFFMLIMLIVGDDKKPPPSEVTTEDMLRAENKELKKRLALDRRDWR